MRLPHARFIVVGAGYSRRREEFEALIREGGLRDRVVLREFVADMAGVYSAVDLVVSSSINEGFSNVLAEAFACGTPCVATHAGDNRVLVGDLAPLVPVGDSDALADACVRALEMTSEERARWRRAARTRIAAEFSVQMLAERTAAELAATASVNA